MAVRRNGPHLFDLIGQSSQPMVKPRYRSPMPPPRPEASDEPPVAVAEPKASARKPVLVEVIEKRGVKPARKPVLQSADPTRAAGAVPPSWAGRRARLAERFSAFKRALSTPASRRSMSVAIAAVALVAVVWIAIGLMSGRGGSERGLDSFVAGGGAADIGIIDPLREVASTGNGVSAPTRSYTDLKGVAAQSPSAEPDLAGLPADTRVAGDNYAVLASNVGREEAIRAALFLTERGVPTVPVGMESDTVGGNNQERMFLISLFGVPGERFSAMRDERKALEERVRALGRIWSREYRGTVDFRAPQWTKYTP